MAITLRSGQAELRRRQVVSCAASGPRDRALTLQAGPRLLDDRPLERNVAGTRHSGNRPCFGSSTAFVVAIPVKDEEERLPACFDALARQKERSGRPMAPKSVRVVVFANNCSDDSAALAGSLAKRLLLDVRVVEASLAPAQAHAGNARRAAMDFAEAWLRRAAAGTCPVDHRRRQPRPRRLDREQSGRDRCGRRRGTRPRRSRRRRRPPARRTPSPRSARSGLRGPADQLSALLDPVEWNPWPHHATISGTSLAVTVKAYRRIGGLPRVPLGEDKALVAKLMCEDARIRFAPEIEVVTSGRLAGRAPGGVADTCACAAPTRTRAATRRWSRSASQSDARPGEAGSDVCIDAASFPDLGKQRATLGLSSDDARRIAGAATFGRAWSIAEAGSPLFSGVSSRPLICPARSRERAARSRAFGPYRRVRTSSRNRSYRSRRTILRSDRYD